MPGRFSTRFGSRFDIVTGRGRFSSRFNFRFNFQRMDMAEAAKWVAIKRMRDDLKTRVSWEQFGDVPPIQADNIVVRYVAYGPSPEGEMWDENVPALILSPPRRSSLQTQLNCSDDYTFPVMIQGVDNDHHRFSEDRISSWTRWEEQVMRYFSEGNLRGLYGTDWHVMRVQIGDQSWVDRKLFTTYRNAVFAIIVAVSIRMGRDANGR